MLIIMSWGLKQGNLYLVVLNSPTSIYHFIPTVFACGKTTPFTQSKLQHIKLH